MWSFSYRSYFRDWAFAIFSSFSAQLVRSSSSISPLFCQSYWITCFHLDPRSRTWQTTDESHNVIFNIKKRSTFPRWSLALTTFLNQCNKSCTIVNIRLLLDHELTATVASRSVRRSNSMSLACYEHASTQDVTIAINAIAAGWVCFQAFVPCVEEVNIQYLWYAEKRHLLKIWLNM